jgi:IgA Peptidase M64
MLYPVVLQTAFLDDLFATIWDRGHGLILDNIVHGIARGVPDFLRPVRPLNPDALARAPGMFNDNGRIKLRIPNGAEYQLLLGLNLDIRATVQFRIEVELATSGTPKTTVWVDIAIDLPDYLEALLAAAGVIGAGPLGAAAASLPTIIERVVKEVLNAQFRGGGPEITAQLAAFSALTFDHDAPYQPGTVQLEALPQATLVNVPSGTPESHLESGPLDWIDIVIVADNWKASEIDNFRNLTAEMATEMISPSRLFSPRLRAMRSVLRIWRLPLLTGTSDGEQLVTTADVDGVARPTLANLARLAETGLRIHGQLLTLHGGVPLRYPPILAIAHKEPSNRRAVALGDLVLQLVGDDVNQACPCAGGPAGDGAAAGSVLVHELGHVVARLADEYADGHPSETYLGPEPAAVNVSTNPVATQKWHRWANHLPQASGDGAYQVHPPGGNEGAYTFGHGIFRPAQRCKMNSSATDEAFCPVCEESLAIGLLERMGLNAAGMRAPLTLLVEYEKPFLLAPSRLYTLDVPLSTGGTNLVIELPAASSTQVRVRLVRSAVPNAKAHISVDGGPSYITEYLDVKRGSSARVEVRSNAPLGEPLHSNLRQTAVLSFNQSSAITVAPPTSLTQQPPVGAAISRVLDVATGDLALSMAMGATAPAHTGPATETLFTLTTGTRQFPVALPNGPGPQQAHVLQLSSLPGLPDGKYRWLVLERIQGTTDLVSAAVELPLQGADCHFELRPRQIPPFQALPRPYGLGATLLDPHDARRKPSQGTPRLAPAAEKDECFARAYHPTGASLQFEFEIKNLGQAFTGASTLHTGSYRPAQPDQSLAVVASVHLATAQQLDPGLNIGRFHFRVRTRDGAGLQSPWTEWAVLN